MKAQVKFYAVCEKTLRRIKSRLSSCSLELTFNFVARVSRFDKKKRLPRVQLKVQRRY